MASTRPRRNKSGEIISYEIRVTRGRDTGGKQLKPYTMTWTPPDGWSKRSIEKELARVAGQFEADCKAGRILTKDEQREQERQRQLEESQKVTFRRYMEIFMQDKGMSYSENTRENYHVALNRACVTLGDLRMADIDFLTIKQYINAMQMSDKNPRNGKPFAHKTVLKHYIVLHAFFENARENKVIPANPMQDMKRPKPRKDELPKPATSYTAQEVARILQCLNNEPLKWKALIMFMLDSGCRRGEAVGLKWDAINFKTGMVEICRNTQYTAGKGTYITTPKSGKARTIYINPPVLAVLKEWQREQAVLFLGQGIPRNGFCFTQDNGRYDESASPHSLLSAVWRKIRFSRYSPPRAQTHDGQLVNRKRS